VAIHVPGDRDRGVPEYLRDGMQWHPRHEHVRGKSVPQRVQTDTVIPKALAASYRPQCLLGLTAVPIPVVTTRPVSTQIEAALSRSTA
jgi:hypothetical protein